LYFSAEVESALGTHARDDARTRCIYSFDINLKLLKVYIDFMMKVWDVKI